MNKFFTVFALVLVSITLLSAVELNVGDKVAPFAALSDTGEMWYSDSSSSEYLVVYFYPAAMTFGCTKQACSYRDNMADFKALNADIVGISGDDVASIKVFKAAENLNFTLLSDKEGKVADHFGVPTSKGGEITKKVDDEKIILKRGVTTKRWTFVLDKSGKILYKDDSVNPLSDAKHVLKELQK